MAFDRPATEVTPALLQALYASEGGPATQAPPPPVFAGSPYPAAAGGWVFPLYPLVRVAPRRWWSLDGGVDVGGYANQCGPKLVELAVKGMLPKNTLGRAQLKKLKVYAGPEHPHAAQQPQAYEITQIAQQPVSQVG